MQGLAVQGRTWAMALSEVRTMEGSELWRDMPEHRCSQAPSGCCGRNRPQRAWGRSCGTRKEATALVQASVDGG